MNNPPGIMILRAFVIPTPANLRMYIIEVGGMLLSVVTYVWWQKNTLGALSRYL